MSKCYQCDKPAMYLVGPKQIPLCLDCNLKSTQIAQIQNDMLQKEMNYLTDCMEMTAGISIGAPRFPEKKTINVQGVNLNNIKINNSTVGVVNTGNIESVDISVTSLTNGGQKELAEAIKLIIESVLSNQELEKKNRDEIIEILSILSSEATAPKEKRHNSSMSILVNRLSTLLSLATSLSSLWTQYGPAIINAFK